MGSRRRGNKHGRRSAIETTRNRKRLPIVIALLGVGLVTAALLVLYLNGGFGSAKNTGESPSATNLPSTAAPVEAARPSPADKASETTAPAAPKPDFTALRGRWLRPDGGYVLEIRNVHDDGRLDAAYLNPRSIHVAKAQAARNGSVTQVFIELRDTNYPGSTYTLVYSPQTDGLRGVYYQAAQQQSFEVYFTRIP